MSPELARLFYRELLKIEAQFIPSLKEKIKALFDLLQLVFIEATKQERIQFTTLFSRIAYVTHKFDFDKRLQFWIHAFRKSVGKKDTEKTYDLGLHVVAFSIQQIFGGEILDELNNIIKEDFDFKYSESKTKAFLPKVRVVALADNEQHNQLIVKDINRPELTIRVRYNIAHRNENFNPSILEIRNTFGFPVSLNLLDVKVDEKGIYHPRAFVIEPDYLMDVSAVSECFKEFGTAPVMYLIKKFLPIDPNKYLMIGNIANFFLDELLSNPEATFQETFPKVFRLNPLAFVLFENAVVREIMQKSQKHFVNLKRLVHQELEKFQIQKEGCYLEPSFYSETYGLQGRLDVFYPNGKDSAIIELKSGSAYMPNQYGISQNHFTQTLLYDLIVKAVFEEETLSTNYILYSGLDNRNLRYAPVVKAQQFEAIQLRNILVAYERKMCQKESELLPKIQTNRYPQLKGFLARDIATFEKVFWGMNELEKAYFESFTAFIAREHQLAKTGIHGHKKANGLANLWLNSFEEKNESFEIASHLQIIDNQSHTGDPILTFSRTKDTNPLANFRKGDIAVLYPKSDSKEAVLRSQIFKGSLIEITPELIRFRLRYSQFNTAIFSEFDYWNLEHDMMDMGFTGMYRGLFKFAKSPTRKKELLLTTTLPSKPEKIEVDRVPELTDEQNDILKKAVSAKDYFLLWGPPGTGKTSKMLKNIVQWLMNETKENLLVLAYTNRAVDEICEAIFNCQFTSPVPEGENSFLRIGSKYSTGDRFQHTLLSEQLKAISNRKELKALLESYRIFVSTVASFSNRTELLNLKKFDRVIIDEASQILEPHLVGLLPNFERFILVGDHQQLPAVVVQDKDQSIIENEDLKAIGLNNLRNSFFERLYKRCQEKNWHWAYAKLSHQGRMHEQIMHFPNEYFYGGFLNTLPDSIEYSKVQKEALSNNLLENPTDLEKTISENRLIFIPTKIDSNSLTQKTNEYEAQMVGKIVSIFKNIYFRKETVFSKNSIGVITPYRAQIAQIQEVLHTKEINSKLITIDTVERYQGGARDIIILSLCTNSERQMDSLVSLSEEGVDRKLNVALTRARQQVIILGNPSVLKTNEIYRKLMEVCQSISH